MNIRRQNTKFHKLSNMPNYTRPAFEILNGRKRGISCDQYCVINIIEQFCENEIKNLRTISSESEMVN